MVANIVDFEDLADVCQMAMADAGGAVWAQETVEEWVLEGIRDFESRFLATKDVLIDVGPGLPRELQLDADVVSIIQVEYPYGEDPPSFLTRFSRFDPRFWEGTGYYDVRISERRGEGPVLFLSDDLVTDEIIKCTCRCLYWDFADFGEPWYSEGVLIPDRYLSIIVDYVVWRALQERVLNQAQAVCASRTPADYQYLAALHGALGALQSAADAARKIYDDAFAAALAAYPPDLAVTAH